MRPAAVPGTEIDRIAAGDPPAERGASQQLRHRWRVERVPGSVRRWFVVGHGRQACRCFGRGRGMGSLAGRSLLEFPVGAEPARSIHGKDRRVRYRCPRRDRAPADPHHQCLHVEGCWLFAPGCWLRRAGGPQSGEQRDRGRGRQSTCELGASSSRPSLAVREQAVAVCALRKAFAT